MAKAVRPALIAFCLAVVALLAVQVLTQGPITQLDRDVSFWLAAHRSGWLTQVMLLVSEVHQTVPLLFATALIAGWRGVRGDPASVRALLAVPTGMLLNVGLKHVFQRARPVWDAPLVHISTYSFPSGHATASTVFYGTLCALVLVQVRSRALRVLAATVAAVMVLLVCSSRVYLGVHYPSDVIAGVAVGTLWVTLFLGLARRWGRAAPAADQASSSG